MDLEKELYLSEIKDLTDAVKRAKEAIFFLERRLEYIKLKIDCHERFESRKVTNNVY